MLAALLLLFGLTVVFGMLWLFNGSQWMLTWAAGTLVLAVLHRIRDRQIARRKAADRSLHHR